MEKEKEKVKEVEVEPKNKGVRGDIDDEGYYQIFSYIRKIHFF